jgi:ribosome-associated protein
MPDLRAGRMKEGAMKKEEEIVIRGEKIQLDQFLKWATVTGTGGEAKTLIQKGKIMVNGEIEKRRGRILKAGDRIALPDQRILIVKAGGENCAAGKNDDQGFP